MNEKEPVNSKTGQRRIGNNKTKPEYIVSFISPFSYNSEILEDKSFQKMALFALFNNPFADTTVSKPPLEFASKQELKEEGRIGLFFSLHFANRLWSHNNLELKDPEWKKAAVSSEFGKAFSFEFVYMGKNGLSAGRVANFFIHLRNAFAHGYFKTIVVGKETYWFFEDVCPFKKKGHLSIPKHLSARICVSEAFLFRLIQIVKGVVSSVSQEKTNEKER